MIGHVLFALLLIAMPLQGWVGMRRLMSGAVPIPERQGLYLSSVLVQAVLALLGVAAWLQMPMGFRRPLPFSAMTASGIILTALMAGVLLWLLLPFVPSPWQAGQRIAVQKVLGRIAFLMPETRRERGLWWLVSVTAGTAEEWLYRAFLPAYLQAWPWHLRGTTVLIFVSSLVFGLAHTYQGVKGVGVTAILGMALAASYGLSQTLLVPMLLHTLIDLRILLLWPPEHRTAGKTE